MPKTFQDPVSRGGIARLCCWMMLGVVMISSLAGCGKLPTHDEKGRPILRVGFFPNITHAQGLVGYHETTTKGEAGWFESRTGAKIEWMPFNAGPSAIEALLTGSVDVTYVGPNPVLNGYTRTKGADIRVLSGATRGGAALVIQSDSNLTKAEDFRGKKIATPQLGGTQDVAARAWLTKGGLQIRMDGGDAFVIPTPNADQIDLFKLKGIDGAWTVEPWVSRLEMNAGGKILLEQNDDLTTLLATSKKAYETREALIKKFVAAHQEMTAKIAAEPDFAKPITAVALHKLTTRPIPAALIARAWPRLKFTTEIQLADFTGLQKDARSVGLLPLEADLGKLFIHQ